LENLSQRRFTPIPLTGSIPDATLRVLRAKDISSAYVNGMNDPAVRQFVSVGRDELDESDITAFVTENWDRPDCVLFGLFVSGVHRGNVRLHDYDGENAWMGIAIFDMNFWGQGFGVQMISTARDFAFEELGCGTVFAGIEPGNTASLAAFKKAGFEISQETENGLILKVDTGRKLSVSNHATR